MEFNKNSSQPVRMVVRASRKIKIAYSNKKSFAYKRDLNLTLLPSAFDYYSEKLNKFHPKGREATALCPFHDDRKPSFSVNLKTGAFLCFSCGARGKSIIGFHAKKHNVSFAQACKSLGVTHE